jgi:adenylylsulfate kinase
LLDKLKKRGVNAQIVSSDMLRKVVTPNPKYTEEERDMVYGAIVFVAELLASSGVNIIIDATGNLRKYRDQARKQIPRFVEAYVRCPLEICIERESRRGGTFHAPKDIYKKAFTGMSATVPGMGAPYDEPLNPEVVVDSDKLNPSQCAQKILDALMESSLNRFHRL